MSLKSRLCFILLAFTFAPPAQMPAQAPSQPGPDQMTIRVTVANRNGDPVEGLTRDDFTLLDNKHQEPITAFRALPTSPAQPTRIIIVLDAVNLPYTQVSYARQQLAQFFSSNGGHLAQPTTLAILQDNGLEIQPTFTTDGNALRSSLDRFSIGLRELTRATGIYGAEERLQISLRVFQGLIEQFRDDGPKRIIWISPGWPLLSGPEVDLNSSQRASIFNQVVAITTETRRFNMVIDNVNPIGATEDVGRTNYYETFLRAPRSPRDIQLGQLGLQVIAQQSGGLVLNGSNDIAGLIQHAIAFSRGAYELSFTPAPGEHENDYHQLQLKTNRPGVTVHTIAGYYANPVFAPLPQPVRAPAVR